ncbi:hypothetical protein M1590_02210 [Candidatus Marsarchaeota archaeon]|nr:hypothetical protein [Candidatus Marsarchaeota archaeon]
MNRFILLMCAAFAIMSFVAFAPLVSAASAAPTPSQLLPSYLRGYCSKGGTIYTVANWYCNDINTQVQEEWATDLPIALLAITIALLVSVSIFMFGVALRNDRLRTFGIGEIYEAFASIIIVVLFMFMAAVLFGLLPSITGTLNPFTASLTYISSIIYESSIISTHLFTLLTTARYYASIALIVCPSEGTCINTFSVFSLAINYLFFWPGFSVFAFTAEAMISLYVQYYMIIFFMEASIPVLFIPGVIFRTLLPTRHLGGMMMATAIGFYFIMPTLYGVAYATTSNSIFSQLTQSESYLNQYGSGTGVITNSVSPGAPLVATLKGIAQTFTAFWLAVLFFPALIIAITYSFITQIAELIGGMARPSSRLRSLV